MKNNNEIKKLNNKGFSLVELIIVIAIMAVLIGVLAPQYLKYVERSRNSSDQDNAAAIASAMQVWGAETDFGGKKAFTAGTGVVTVNATGGSITTENNTSAVSDALTNAGITIANVKCTSKTKWTSNTVTATIDANGTVTTAIQYLDASGAIVTP